MIKEKDKSVQTSCKIDKKQLVYFIQEISLLQGIIRVEPKNIHEEVRFSLQEYIIIVYKSGKIVYHVFHEFNELLKKYCINFEEQTVLELQNKYNYNDYDIVIGQDEVGKGEMYGPMITASVALKTSQLTTFKKAGIKDSKLIKSKTKMKNLTIFIEENALAISVSKLYPKRFNELFKEMKAEEKNLNDLLAWQHANALKTMLDELDKKKLSTMKILLIIDEFDRFKTNIRLKNQLWKNIDVIQSTKAEKISVAVAAASIVAKNKRNEQLGLLEDKFGIILNNSTVKSLVNHPQSNEFLKISFIKK